MKLSRNGVLAACATAVLMTATGAHAGGGAVTINDYGPATPYPSTFEVAGIQSEVLDVNVTLVGFSHTHPSDVDILLVGPSGQKVILMSDAGGSTPVNNANLTFDDSASAPMSSGPITSGTYRPTNLNDLCSGDDFPAPAPPPPYATVLSAFNGQNANGSWNLFVRDDCFFGGGSIADWTLSIRTCLLPEVVALTEKTPAGPIVASLLCH